MGDPYPYNYSSYPTKRKPMDAFLQSFLGSMEKLLMYKYQQTLQDDSTAKRLTMEREYEAQRQRDTAENFANDPLRKSQIDQNIAQTEKIRAEIANPKDDRPWWARGGTASGSVAPANGISGVMAQGVPGLFPAATGDVMSGQSGWTPEQAQAARDLLSAEKGIGAAGAGSYVPTQESQAEAVAEKDAARVETEFQAMQRARLTGALAGSPELAKADEKLQKNLGTLADARVGVTGRGMDALAEHAMGRTSEPPFVEERKRTWADMVKKRDASEKTTEDEGKINKRAEARARELKIPFAKAKDQIVGGASDSDTDKFLNAVAKPDELSRRMQIILKPVGVLKAETAEGRRGYYAFSPKDDFTPIRVQEQLRQYRDELIQRGATEDEARTTINDLVERMSVYANYDWVKELQRVQGARR